MSEYDFDEIIPRRGTGSAKWDEVDADVLPLWVAELDFRAPDPVIRALHERVSQGVFGYSRPSSALYEALAARLQRMYGWTVSPDSMVAVPGVALAFNLACRAFAQPGQGVLVQTPVYTPMLLAPLNAHVERTEAQLVQDGSGHYQLDWHEIETAIRPNTRLFLLCSPHNPTGRVYTRPELERMAETALRHELVLCSDEVHSDIVYSESRHIPIASLSPEVEARTITLLAPSKTFNLPGLRCSIAVIPNKDLREQYQVANAGMVGAINTFADVAATAAYRDGQDWLDHLLRYLQGNRDILAEFVRTRLPGITMSTPEGTYLAWLDCRGAGIPGSPCEFFLRQARVALNDGAEFGRGGDGFVRLIFGCPRSMLVEALERMERALASLH